MPLNKTEPAQPAVESSNVVVDLKDAKPPQEDIEPRKPRKPRKDKGQKRGGRAKPATAGEMQYHFKFLAVAFTAALAIKYGDPVYNATAEEADEFDKAIDDLLNYYAGDLEALTPWFRLISVSCAYSLRILMTRRPRHIQRRIESNIGKAEPIDFDALTPDEIKRIEADK